MSHAPTESTLDRHYVTLILRLTLDRGGRLLQGELVATTDSRPHRFIDLDGLHRTIETWLKQQEGGADTLSLPR